jgi:hypothetical protein
MTCFPRATQEAASESRFSDFLNAGIKQRSKSA